MEPTDAQVKLLRKLRDDYGTKVVKPHAPNRETGVMRVSLTCAAGVWEWYFDQAGGLVDRSLTMRLFDPPLPPANPRNAIDN